MLWEHEPQASVFTAFSSSPKRSRVFYNSIETRIKCFLFLLENSPRKIMENEENLIINQSARVLSLSYFLINNQFMRQRLYVEILSTREVWRAQKRRKRRSRVQLLQQTSFAESPANEKYIQGRAGYKVNVSLTPCHMSSQQRVGQQEFE